MRAALQHRGRRSAWGVRWTPYSIIDRAAPVAANAAIRHRRSPKAEQVCAHRLWHESRLSQAEVARQIDRLFHVPYTQSQVRREMSVSPRARADLATCNSQLAGVAPMKNGARFCATSQPDPTDATHGRLKDSDLARCLKRREMALWALDKKRQFSPFL